MKATIGVGSGGTLAIALAALAVVAPPASAAPAKIAGWGEGAGKVNGPRGVAVDQASGELYVAALNNFRVDRFDSEGEFLLAWGAGVADGVSEELQVCGPEAPEPTKRCFKGLLGSEETVAPRAVTVEAATGEVYAGEPDGRRVSKFTPTGEFVFALGKDVNKTKVADSGASQAERDICTAASGDVCGKGKVGTGPGEFKFPASLAFDGEGKLWVNDGGERTQRFDSGGGFLGEVTLPTGTQSSALAIDPTSDDFYVLGPGGANEEQSFRRAESGEYTLAFEGEMAGPFPAGKPTEEGAEEIQEALEALPAIGEGNVSVRSGPFKYFVTFIGDLGGRDVSQLLASGGTPPVTVTTVTEGSPGSVLRLDSEAGAQLDTLDDEDGDLPEALATDAAGNLYIGDAGVRYRLERYDPVGNLNSVFGADQVLGGPIGNALALDEGGEYLYTASAAIANGPGPAAEEVAVQRFSLPGPGPLASEARAEDVLPTEATLAATLNPEGEATHYRFQYVTEAAYEEDRAEGGDGFDGPATEETAEEFLPGTGYEEEDVSAEVKGLIPDTAYRFRVLATNSAGEAEAEAAFATPTAVGIEAQWASELSAHEATLNARLDPLGPEARWWLEYDTSPYLEGDPPHGTSAPVPHPALPAGFGEVPVAVALGGLNASTAYHYRFVATDVREVKEGGETVERLFTTYGPGQSFTTQSVGLGFSLPESRAWEMVSPPDKHGGRIAPPDPIVGGPVQAAANGEALAYLSYGSLEADPEGNRIVEQSSELARRAPGGAWSSTDITPPHTEAAGLNLDTGLEYKLFSTNLGRALLEPHAPTQLSPYASQVTLYLRENSSPPAYTPLAVGCPPEGEPCPPETEEHANVPAGTEFEGRVTVRGASPDLGLVVLKSKVPLAKDAAGESLYQWSDGVLEPLSVLPDGEGGKVVSAKEGANAVSEDGSRVFWRAAAGGLYMRDTADEETLRLDDFEKYGGFGTGEVNPRFRGASSDGSLAFFTDTQNLTADANEEGADLYRWEAQGTHGCKEEGGCLDDLTADVATPGESAEVQGAPGVAKDASAAFFVARGVLDEVPSAFGEGATPGQPNLYVWRDGEGTRFIATLSAADSTDWNATWALTAGASPSGRYLAFMSERPLTGYDNRAVGSGERAQEVFRYDALTDKLACVSCSPSGARPRAVLEGAPRSLAEDLLDPASLWGSSATSWEATLAALVPEAFKFDSSGGGISLYAPRYVHDDGRVFFNALDSLVPADSNGAGDVYEYSSRGSEGCRAASASAGTALAPGGCVSLISSGTAAGPSGFLDASRDASDVFFYSLARLSVTDEDDEVDVYDARVGGEAAVLEPLAECLGEACQPPAIPPLHTAGATATHHGPGNVREKGAVASRCAAPARKAKRLARRAKALRRGAGRMARNHRRAKARRMSRRARRLARKAKGTSKRAKRCRRARAKRRSSR